MYRYTLHSYQTVDELTTSSLTPDWSLGGRDLFVLTADSARRFLVSRRTTLRDLARPM